MYVYIYIYIYICIYQIIISILLVITMLRTQGEGATRPRGTTLGRGNRQAFEGAALLRKGFATKYTSPTKKGKYGKHLFRY